MKLYIANTTKQNVEFNYRVPENPQLLTQRIQAGGQTAIYKDTVRSDLDYIVNQHAIYGLREACEIDRSGTAFIGLCYSFDKPVSLERIVQVFENNDDALMDMCTEIRKAQAAALVDKAQQDTQGAVNSFEMEFVEQRPSGLEDDSAPIAQVIEVETGRRSRGRPRKGE